MASPARSRALLGGPARALLSATLFGVSAPLAKSLLARSSPQMLAGLLYLGSGVGLMAFWTLRRVTLRTRYPAEKPLGREDVPWLAGAYLAGGVLGPLLLMVGLMRTPASSASLLLNLEGVFTAVLAWTLFREHAPRRIILGMVFIVGGGLVISWEGRAGWAGTAGPLAVAGACLCWGIDNNLTQRVSGGDPVQVAGLKGLVAGSVNLALGLALGGADGGAGAVGAALLLGLVSYGISLVLFILALRDLGTARTGAYFSTAPFIGAAAAVLILREAVSGSLLAGGALMAVGVWLHLTERHKHFHVHKAVTHTHRHVHDEHHQHEHPPGTPTGEPHAHEHTHEALAHSHPHYPDLHHRHRH